VHTPGPRYRDDGAPSRIKAFCPYASMRWAGRQALDIVFAASSDWR